MRYIILKDFPKKEHALINSFCKKYLNEKHKKQ